MATRKAFTWWNGYDGLIHQIYQSPNHPDDWDIACDQPASAYGPTTLYVTKQIRKAAKARDKNHQVTCLRCVVAARSSTASG